MSATERVPELVREQRERELAASIARARAQLGSIRAETAALERRIDANLQCRRGPVLLRMLAGLVTLPLIIIASVCLTMPLTALHP